MITVAPMVTLVDVDGGPVPVWERDAPVIPPPDPAEESDPATWPAWTDDWHWTPTEDLGVPPVAGGAPEYEPTPDDLADYAQWAAELDARRGQEAFYAAHPLAEFNALRAD